jgi:hypothetical protein
VSFNWSVFKGLALLATVAVACPALASAGTFDLEELMNGNVPPYTIRAGHPRLFITPENKALIIRRITDSDLGRRSFQRLITIADNGITKDFSPTGIPLDWSGRSAYPQFAHFIEAYGILYQLGTLLGVPEAEPADGQKYLVQTSANFVGFTLKHGVRRYRDKGVEAYLAFVNHARASLEGPHGGKYTAFATGYDLGIPAGHLHAGFFRRVREAGNHTVEQRQFQPFLDEGIEREIKRLGTGDGEVVYRAVDRERTDVAAGEFQRLHREAIGREHRLAAAQRQRHGVGLDVEQ